MKVGIVGSSYSVGMHYNPDGEDPLALPFEKWLYEHTDGIEFFNSACAGKGSELYLNKLVYLKEKHEKVLYKKNDNKINEKIVNFSIGGFERKKIIYMLKK